jgi:hypothetical protein
MLRVRLYCVNLRSYDDQLTDGFVIQIGHLNAHVSIWIFNIFLAVGAAT